MQHRRAGDRAHVERTRLTLAAKGAGAKPALLIAVENDAHMLQFDQRVTGLTHHHLHGVLIRQEVRALDRVVGVALPLVTAICECCINTALRRARVAAHRVDLGEHRGVYAKPYRLNRSPKPGETRSDYQHVMFVHSLLRRGAPMAHPD